MKNYVVSYFIEPYENQDIESDILKTENAIKSCTNNSLKIQKNLWLIKSNLNSEEILNKVVTILEDSVAGKLFVSELAEDFYTSIAYNQTRQWSETGYFI